MKLAPRTAHFIGTNCNDKLKSLCETKIFTTPTYALLGPNHRECTSVRAAAAATAAIRKLNVANVCAAMYKNVCSTGISKCPPDQLGNTYR